MADNTVKVTVVADQKELDGAIDISVEKLKRAAAELDIFNATAVKAFMESANATKNLNQELGATTAQLRALDQVTEQVGARADAAGTRTANAFERGARGMSVMARQGTVTARSLNQIIAAGADIAFAFGPEGAIISGILMVTAGVVSYIEMAEQKMVDIVDKFNEHMDQMLANSTPIEIAKAAANAYISQLEAIAKLKRDSEAGAFDKIFPGGGDISISGMAAWFRTIGEKKVIAEKGAEKAAGDEASRIVGSIDGSDKDLANLKKDREQLNREIATGEETLRGLDRENNRHQYEEAEARLARAQKKLADTERLTRQLEIDRDARLKDARAEAILTANGPLDATLEFRSKWYKGYEKADFAAEHTEREEGVSGSSKGGTGAKRDRADAAAQRARDAALEREARGQEHLQELEDQILQRHLLSLGLKEAAEIAAAQREFALESARILNMKVSEDLKTKLMLAAVRDRDEKVADITKADADKVERAAISARNRTLANEMKAVEQKTQTIAHAEIAGIDAMIAGKESLGRRILAAEGAVMVSVLKAKAEQAAIISAADFASGNWAEGARYALGASIYAIGAATVAAMTGAGGGSGGGSAGAGAGAGGGAGAAASMGTNSSQQSQTIKIEIVNVTKDQTGREVARTQQMIQRLTDLRQPIRVTL